MISHSIASMPESIPRDILRSLLQKSIRRGNNALAVSVAYELARQHDSQWVNNRIGIIVFEECWQKSHLLIDNSINLFDKLELISNSAKQKDAAGLGTLGYYLSQNDLTTIDFSPDPRAVKIVAAGVRRPADFFKWAIANSSTENIQIIYAIHNYYNLASWPWDKAFAIAAVYLHISNQPPFPNNNNKEILSNFPYWVAIDKHTREGKQKLQQISKINKINYNILSLASFYFEGANVNSLSPSIWWDHEIIWHCNKLKISKNDLESIWIEIRDQVKISVKETSEKLNIFFSDHSNTYFEMDRCPPTR